jgi:hypothetical protein
VPPFDFFDCVDPISLTEVKELSQVAAIGIDGVIGQSPLFIEPLQVAGDATRGPIGDIGKVHCF